MVDRILTDANGRKYITHEPEPKQDAEIARLRELVEQLKSDLKTALQAYRDVVSKM